MQIKLSREEILRYARALQRPESEGVEELNIEVDVLTPEIFKEKLEEAIKKTISGYSDKQRLELLKELKLRK